MKKALLIALVLASSVAHAKLSRQDINTVVPGSKESTHGLRAFKPVLDGVLYRGGGAGGKKPMSEESLTALCEQGFTDAGYLYPDGWRNQNSVSCNSGRIEYKRYGFKGASEASQFLSTVRDLIKNGGKMFVHCWNGWHASGEVAAYALIQFCDWSPSEADKYWQENRGDKSVISRIKKFEKIAGLEITSAEKARVCPAK